jgi:septal ring factor EnvC (AmiA/AmiB activator)
MVRFVLTFAVVFAVASPVVAQDIRGLEVCTAEKAMDRRTSCLQSNVEFLHQTLDKLARETRNRLAVADREIAAQKAEIAVLKAALAKLHHELAELKKPKPAKQ